MRGDSWEKIMGWNWKNNEMGLQPTTTSFLISQLVRESFEVKASTLHISIEVESRIELSLHAHQAKQHM